MARLKNSRPPSGVFSKPLNLDKKTSSIAPVTNAVTIIVVDLDVCLTNDLVDYNGIIYLKYLLK